MIVLAVALVAAAALPWRQIAGVDSRTQYEMIMGVAHHGLPTVENGPVEQFPVLAARWTAWHDGHLWGTYPPLLAYSVAPLYRLGGLELATKGLFVWLALLLVGVHRLAFELTRRPDLAALAAWGTFVASPVLAHAVVPRAFIPAAACIVWATFFAERCRHSQGTHQRRWALAAGLAGGLGIAAHLIVLPMFIGVLAVLSLGNSRGAAYTAAGTLPPLIATGALNYQRFASFNPISYGPCVWQVCSGPRGLQSTAGMLGFGAPAILWLATTLLLLRLLRSHRWRGAATMLFAGLTALAVPSIRETLARSLELGWGLVVDSSHLDLAPQHRVAADGIGQLRGGYALKSVLQASPALLLGLLARGRSSALVAAPIALLVAAILLRGPAPDSFALGHSAIHFRYALPGLGLCWVLVAVALGRFETRARHVVLGVAGAALAAVLLAVDNDGGWLRRVLLLRIGPIAAVVVCALALYDRRQPTPRRTAAVAWAATLLVAWSASVNVGIDVRRAATSGLRNGRTMRELGAGLPERFAVMGRSLRLDPFLVNKEEHDIEYLDLTEQPALADALDLVRHWWSRGRPVYLLTSGTRNAGSAWPSARLVPVARGLVQVIPRSPAPPQ
jgi:hypothetical protein